MAAHLEVPRLDRLEWTKAARLELTCLPWGSGAPRRTVMRVALHDDTLWWRVEAEDRHIYAQVVEPNGPVYTDACAELFLTPAAERGGPYLNLEVNAIGTVHLAFGPDREHRRLATKDELATLTVRTSLPRVPREEASGDDGWWLEVGLPLATIASLSGSEPGNGPWYANFYRCGGRVDPEHATWAPVRAPRPDFHRPEQFGRMDLGLPYVLGTDPAEEARLGLQHRLWADTARAAWASAGFGAGARILDVGCGPGFASLDLEQLGCVVVGVDESPGFVRAARAAGLRDVRSGDVQRLAEPLAGEAAFDGAWARWVLCFVPDPEAVVAGVAAALRPGGRFVVHDYFDYEGMALAPRSPAFARVVGAVAASFRARGGDPDVAGRLPGLFARHGLTVERVVVHQWIARPHEPRWAWPDTFFRAYVPKLVASGFLTTREAEDWRQDWDERCASGDGFMLMPTVLEVVGVRDAVTPPDASTPPPPAGTRPGPTRT
jgi:SAM-dependent methyltransferase